MRVERKSMWLWKALMTLLLVQRATAVCNVCQSESNIACHSETTFSICYDGEPSYNLLNCPSGFYCTDDFYTCYENATPVCTSEEDTTTTTAAPWSADDQCQQQSKTTFVENKDDPTCTTYIVCLVEDGTYSTNVVSCKADTYFNSNLKACTSTLPDGCVEAATTTTVSTTIPTTTTTAITTTTTAKPWSAEETCLTVSKSTSFANEDDPTCTTFLFCYVQNGATTALIKNCPTGQYFNKTGCSATKPDSCT
ncbi:salivary glue protein Sgs-3 isoform X1 [Drosophila bipectinata]|uniref:salivary glue protein Sgs-3 isoform X1 n=1 Tax=Drosophila bipectinata TaxID=42026 RepID=UPI0038B2AD9A